MRNNGFNRQVNRVVSAEVPKTLNFTLFVAMCLIPLAGCGGGGDGGGAGTPSSPAPAPSVADPLYLECTSAVPIDAGNADQPVITLLGEKVVNHPLGTQYMDAGAYALDPRAGNISSQIQVSDLAGLEGELPFVFPTMEFLGIAFDARA